MLGYRHAFHAGNHADIFKHFILYHTLKYLVQKDVPLLYVDTHAGAGMYSLNSGYAAQNEEWQRGYQKLSGYSEPLPESIQSFRSFLLSQTVSKSQIYPGSPLIADTLLRDRDRRVFFELHSTDYETLAKVFEHKKQVSIFHTDGFTALKGLLPPTSRRACIFMDPSYELATDYERILESITEGLRRFPTGTYLIWYPLLSRKEAQKLPQTLLSLYQGNRCFAEIQVQEATPRGMFGSGMVILNPPWILQTIFQETLYQITQILTEEAHKIHGRYCFQFFP